MKSATRLKRARPYPDEVEMAKKMLRERRGIEATADALALDEETVCMIYRQATRNWPAWD